MPNRIIKESITTSDTVDLLSFGAEVFFTRLMVVVDDFGRMDARPMVLRAKCFPLRLDRVSDADVAGWLGELQAAGLVVVYAVAGRSYLQFATWGKHQQVRAMHSKYPCPEGGQQPEPAVQPEAPADNGDQLLASDSKCPRYTLLDTRESESIHENMSAPASADVPVDPHPNQLARRPQRKNRGTAEYSEDFEAFWSDYPRKVNKHGAWICWQRCVKSGVSPAPLIASAGHFAAYHEQRGTEDEFIPHASTFLGPQRRWRDFEKGAPAPNGKRGPVARKFNAIDAATDRFTERSTA